jgi:hypothetical protein
MDSIPESALQRRLPAVPESFLRELPRIATREGVPVFRLANGLTEMHFRNGKMTIKHPLQHPAYFVRVDTVRFRRKNIKTGDYHLYRTFEDAQGDKNKDLAVEIDRSMRQITVPVGRPCWVVEAWISPSEIDYDTWQKNRYDYLEKMGVAQKIDVLGPYPSDGYYKGIFDVIDGEGNAIAPSERTLNECKRRWRMATSDTQTLEEAIQGSEEAMALFEEREIDRLADNMCQFHGQTVMSRITGGVTRKPIATVKE